MTTESKTYSVRQGTHGKWAVYTDAGRVSRFFDTRMDAIFLGVRQAERDGK